MYSLVITTGDVFCNGPEPGFEIWNCILIRIVIVDTESTTEVDIVHFQAFALEVGDNLIDSLALETENFFNACDL